VHMGSSATVLGSALLAVSGPRAFVSNRAFCSERSSSALLTLLAHKADHIQTVCGVAHIHRGFSRCFSAVVGLEGHPEAHC
jgi:UDP-N-acetylglucosamine enolpyruvyl transferase